MAVPAPRYTAACPSCGAPVGFRSSVSLVAICEFCQSTLVRHDKELQNLGKMADLLPDSSPIQLGTEGVYGGIHFAVIGRIQLQYEAGVWNEWHLLFDNMRSGWLSEAGGVHFLTFPRALKEPVPASRAATLHPDDVITLDEREFTVMNVDQARCVGGAGELPFQVGAGYDLVSVDLREGKAVATLDFSQDPAIFYVGEQVDFANLKLSNLREAEQKQLGGGAVQSFGCPSCGAPLQVHSERIAQVVCPSCHSTVGSDNGNIEILAAAGSAQRIEPLIKLGAVGKLQGKDWEVIGFQCRETKSWGVTYRWQEYLLYTAPDDFAWLVVDRGHWSFGQAIRGVPRNNVGEVTWNGQSYAHFTTGYAKTAYVVGEFYWRAKVGDENEGTEYVAPPLMLSKETTATGTDWTQLEYLEPDEVKEAFGLGTMPERRGVGNIQPNPYDDTHGRVLVNYGIMFIVVLLAQLAFWLFLPHATLPAGYKSYQVGDNEESQLVTFHLDSTARNVAITGNADLDNDWVALDMSLVHQQTGNSADVNEEVSYYSGYEGGESWSEGSRNFRSYVGDLPPGDYTMLVSAEVGRDNFRPVSTNLKLEYGAISWVNFILAQLCLLAFPLITWWNKKRFENKRWSDSDHPPEDSDDDDDGGGFDFGGGDD